MKQSTLFRSHETVTDSSELPLVSIVIPTFNQGSYLPACIDSCLFQTYPNIELIIVDGGSTDSTKSYLSLLRKKVSSTTYSPISQFDDKDLFIREPIPAYPQNRSIHIITHESDIGPTRTYNTGLEKCSGKYCTYVVGDDLTHPHMIEELVTTLETTGVDFVYSDMLLIKDSGEIVTVLKMPEYDFQKCFADWFKIGVSKLYKTALHEKVGLMDEAYTAANDYDHYLRFAQAGGSFLHVKKILYSVRWHGPDRQTGQHTEQRYSKLLDESRSCALRARSSLQQQHHNFRTLS